MKIEASGSNPDQPVHFMSMVEMITPTLPSVSCVFSWWSYHEVSDLLLGHEERLLACCGNERGHDHDCGRDHDYGRDHDGHASDHDCPSDYGRSAHRDDHDDAHRYDCVNVHWSQAPALAEPAPSSLPATNAFELGEEERRVRCARTGTFSFVLATET